MNDNDLAGRIAKLESAAENQRARNAIYDTMMRFYRGIDRLDRDLMMSALHPEFRQNGLFDGNAEEFVNWVCRPEKADYVASLHQVTNIVMHIDGKVARCESYISVLQRRKMGDGFMDIQSCGRNLDRFEERNGEWRVTERHAIGEFNWTNMIEAKPPNPHAPRMVHGTFDKTDPSYIFFAGGAVT